MAGASVERVGGGDGDDGWTSCPSPSDFRGMMGGRRGVASCQQRLGMTTWTKAAIFWSANVGGEDPDDVTFNGNGRRGKMPVVASRIGLWSRRQVDEQVGNESQPAAELLFCRMEMTSFP